MFFQSHVDRFRYFIPMWIDIIDVKFKSRQTRNLEDFYDYRRYNWPWIKGPFSEKFINRKKAPIVYDFSPISIVPGRAGLTFSSSLLHNSDSFLTAKNFDIQWQSLINDCIVYDTSFGTHRSKVKLQSKKKKSHSHHIIPFYRIEFLSLSKTNNYFAKVVGNIDNYISIVPFYFSLIISFCSIFLLFFIFLHKYDSITNINFSYIFPVPVNITTFIVFYGGLFFYCIIFFHSLFKFFVHIFSEVRSQHIYTPKVEAQNILGISLFILSETMLFFSFFWAFFHSSLSPGLFIGNCWPPLGITTLNPWHIPFLNTCILLTSGITVNWFFFTLKRFSYITFKSSAYFINKPVFNLYIIYSAVFKFMFVDFQKNELRLAKMHPLYILNYANNKIRSLKLVNLIIISLIKSNFNKSKFYIIQILLLLVNKASWTTDLYKRTILIVINTISYNINPYFANIPFNLFSFSFSHISSFIHVNSNYYKHLILSIIDDIYFFKLYSVRSFEDMYLGLLLTLYLGLMFLIFQFCEYEFYADFRLDNIYGTVFYSLTLLHGFHVYVGLFSLTMCFSYFHSFRVYKSDMNKGVFYNFWIIFAVWYWHFVDIVWIFLFCTVYIWGS